MTRLLPHRLLPLLALLAIAACSTIEGAGQDLQAAGQVVSEEAREAEAGL